jgi:quercetin dioxygenase-like cupin family protein
MAAGESRVPAAKDGRPVVSGHGRVTLVRDATPSPHYRVKEVATVAGAAELRVRWFVLAPGEKIPWHYHSAITDRFFCLAGRISVETRAPRQRVELAPGDDFEVVPKTAHEVRNIGDGDCRFLIVQGVGAYDYVPVGG